jgi:hypothetical protein
VRADRTGTGCIYQTIPPCVNMCVYACVYLTVRRWCLSIACTYVACNYSSVLHMGSLQVMLWAGQVLVVPPGMHAMRPFMC